MIDLLFDTDIVIKNGDFVLGESTESHAEDIIQASKGNFFWNPLLGYGLTRDINSNRNVVQIGGEIIKELKKESIRIKNIEIVDNVVNFDIY